jgi:hypothetical protein
MRVLVCGGRNYHEGVSLFTALDAIRIDHDTLIIIQGGASGADQLAREWCVARCVPYINYPADWRTHGKKAGPIRNQQMLDDGKPDLVMAFPGGRGTADMVRRATDANIKVIMLIRLTHTDTPDRVSS